MASARKKSAACCARPLTLQLGCRLLEDITDTRPAEVVRLCQRTQPDDVRPRPVGGQCLVGPDKITIGLVDDKKRSWMPRRDLIKLSVGDEAPRRVAGITEPDGALCGKLRRAKVEDVERSRTEIFQRAQIFAVDRLKDAVFPNRW